MICWLIGVLGWLVGCWVQELLADGQLNKVRMQQLKEMQAQMGLKDEAADAVVNQITSQKMAGAIERAIQSGRLSINDIKGLKESGVDVKRMVAESARLQIFRQSVKNSLGKGKGVFDEHELCV